MLEEVDQSGGDSPREVVADAIREAVGQSTQPGEVGELIASWYAEVLEGNVQLEPETAAVRERAFQELERVFDRMSTPTGDQGAPVDDAPNHGGYGAEA